MKIKALAKMIKEKKDMCISKVTDEIEKYAINPNVEYLDAVCYFCEQHDVEVEDIVNVLHDNIIEKIKLEAMNNKTIKELPTAKLPF